MGLIAAIEFGILRRPNPKTVIFFFGRDRLMNENRLLILVSLIVMFQSGCAASRPNATAGGLFGGAAGSVLGAAIGAHDGKAKEGALLGAVAGGLTGVALGNQADQANSRNYQIANEQAYLAKQSLVTIGQVIQMSQSGLSDELIMTQISANGLAQRLTTNDLVQLKSTGVSDNVIQQMQMVGAQSQLNSAPRLRPSVPAIYVDPNCPSAYHPPVFLDSPVFHHRPIRRRSHAGFSIQL